MKTIFKYLYLTTIALVSYLLISCNPTSPKEKFRSSVQIPTKGNSWVTNIITDNEKMISDSGITNWTNTGSIIQTYFRLEHTGPINVAIRAKVKSGKSKILCSLGYKSIEISFSNSALDTIYIGTFNILNTGYQSLKM
jgi:hypothetical protein